VCDPHEQLARVVPHATGCMELVTGLQVHVCGRAGCVSCAAVCWAHAVLTCGL
jgi:hypothetical protein